MNKNLILALFVGGVVAAFGVLTYTVKTQHTTIENMKSELKDTRVTLEKQIKNSSRAQEVKDSEVKNKIEHVQYVEKVNTVIQKSNPKLAEDANALWKEATKDETSNPSDSSN